MPDSKGKYGEFGGRFIPETLYHAVEELEHAYLRFKQDEDFSRELKNLLRQYAGRPTPLYFARNLTRFAGGAKIYLKRESSSSFDRLQDAERRYKRSSERLGYKSYGYTLPYRLGCRATSLSYDGKRLSKCDRQRGQDTNKTNGRFTT